MMGRKEIKEIVVSEKFVLSNEVILEGFPEEAALQHETMK